MFVESIRVTGGRVFHLEEHQRRMARTIREVYGDSAPVPCLEEAIRVDGAHLRDTWKCRVLYLRGIEVIDWGLRPPKRVESLQVVRVDGIDYHLKTTDRNALNVLFARRNGCDDIIIVREGLVTDACAANLLFEDGDGRLFTPSRPLLKGTCRARLLREGVITQRDIAEDEIYGFCRVHLINAFINPGETVIPLSRVNK